MSPEFNVNLYPWKGAFDDVPREELEYALWWLLDAIPDSMVAGRNDVYERKGDTDKVFPNTPPRLNIAARRVAARACSLRDAIAAGRKRNWQRASPHERPPESPQRDQ